MFPQLKPEILWMVRMEGKILLVSVLEVSGMYTLALLVFPLCGALCNVDCVACKGSHFTRL